MVRATQNQKFGKLLQVTKGDVQRENENSGQVRGQNDSGDVSDSVTLGIQTESEKTGWLRRRHEANIEDADGNPSLKFEVPEIDGEGYVIVSDSNAQGHEAQVKIPVGPLNAVAKYFDPESPFELLPDIDKIERVEVDKEGRDVEIKVMGEGRTTTYDFGRSHFSVANT